MAKTKISEFSTTPGNNTDINGINISEGCAPSGINNAIRELMSDLKEWQSGAMDVYVIPQGTAAAPGIQLYGDLDTGLYGYAANQLGVAVGGASAGYFSSAGWVGNVNGTITGDINATTIDTTNLEVTNIKAKDGTAAITIADSTGVVSVSTTLDLTTVEVTNIKAKDGTAAIALTDSTGVVTLARTTSATNSVNEMLVLEHYSTGTISAGFGSGIKFFGENTSGGNSVYAAIHAVWEGGIGDPSGGALVFLTDGYVGDNTERVRITSEGKVGIGTATPSTTLEVAGSATVTGATTLSATTQNIALGTSQTTGTFTVGGAAQTGTQTFDQSTKTHTLNLGTGATESGLTKTINLGTAGVSGSTTAITVGSANGTTTTLNGTVTAATLNSTTIDTTNIEVTNIKAKDGTAALSIADSTGVVSVSANPVLSGGTANGVVYLNASKAATSGSALTFDGTVQTIGSATSQNSLFKQVIGSGGANEGVVIVSGATGKGWLGFNNGNNANIPGQVTYNFSNNTLELFSNGGPIAFSANGSERMRLTSTSLNIGGNFTSTNNTLQVTGNAAIGYTTAAPTTGLIVAGNVGIGTDAPGVKLDIAGNATVQNGVLTVGKDTVYDAFINSPESMYFNVDSDANSSGNKFTWGTDRTGNTGGTTWMTLDSSGNLGIGVTPSAWKSEFKVLQLNARTSLFGSADSTFLSTNEYIDSAGTSRYIQTGSATRYRQDDRSHIWSYAASGTAGNAITFTQAMTLDASGNLLVAQTSASFTTVGASVRANGSVNSCTTGAVDSFNFYSASAGAYRFFVTSAGAINATSTSITAISDASLKENIRDLDTGLAQVMALKPRRFDWKEETQIGAKDVAGFIAQEVESVLPELVYEYKYNEAETKKSLKMGDMVPTLVKAIQEQQAMIKQLEAKVAALEAK